MLGALRGYLLGLFERAAHGEQCQPNSGIWPMKRAVAGRRRIVNPPLVVMFECGFYGQVVSHYVGRWVVGGLIVLVINAIGHGSNQINKRGKAQLYNRVDGQREKLNEST